ncbi:hypothetical protein CRUP_004027 [Coryphaenoides rupestris]|nr:hypothetical protein CRUP_004027 [Coryphaenoides rupestris]
MVGITWPVCVVNSSMQNGIAARRSWCNLLILSLCIYELAIGL